MRELRSSSPPAGKLNPSSAAFRRRAVITGITGQDGSYLAEFLLSKGYEVHGLIRRAPDSDMEEISPVSRPGDRLFLHYCDLRDGKQLTHLMHTIQPEEVYHLGAQSNVGLSFDTPEYTGDVTALGTTRVLEAIRRSGVSCRFYQASSSEMFGAAPPPQNEQTPFYPRSPYAASKVYAYWMTVNYREGNNIFACNGILFNHESPRRGKNFVTRKVTRGIADILAGKQEHLYMGNLSARRDWGYAPEYVEGIWLILQQEKPLDLVLGTGEVHSVQEFLEEAFGYANLDWRDHVKVDPKHFRPTDVQVMQADAAKARREIGWNPQVTFRQLVRIMMDADLEAGDLPAPGEGKRCLAGSRLTWLRRP